MALTWLRGLDVWTVKVHTYVGLVLLSFLWLFCLSGMLLNHPRWVLLGAWEQRRVETETRPVQPPEPGTDLAAARAVMQQLDLAGEVGGLSADTTARRLSFGVMRPGVSVQVTVDWAHASAEVKTTRTGGWGALAALHTFSGAGRGRETRDWLLTRLWVTAMDALCVGLVVLVVSSLYLWGRGGRMGRSGWVALGAGVCCCAFFVWGI